MHDPHACITQKSTRDSAHAPAAVSSVRVTCGHACVRLGREPPPCQSCRCSGVLGLDGQCRRRSGAVSRWSGERRRRGLRVRLHCVPSGGEAAADRVHGRPAADRMHGRPAAGCMAAVCERWSRPCRTAMQRTAVCHPAADLSAPHDACPFPRLLTPTAAPPPPPFPPAPALSSRALVPCCKHERTSRPAGNPTMHAGGERQPSVPGVRQWLGQL